MADAVIGIVANPLSGRDIRRLVARASVFPTAEKAAMILRMLAPFGLLGVDRVLLSTDLGGISAAVLRAVRAHRADRDPPWPEVHFLDDDPITQSADDTALAVRRMVALGARVIICLGGDGTARVAAGACGEVPLLPLSTGTNNVFPEVREATVAGLAAGLIATGAVPACSATTTSPVLEVVAGSRREIALVDVARCASGHVGSRAVWDPAALRQLFCTFAEPDAIGLSSIPGLLCPSGRTEPDGVALVLGPVEESPFVVHAPIAPGLVAPVGVRSWAPLRSGQVEHLDAGAGVLSLDGEREIELDGGPAPTVRLRPDGPRCVDVHRALALAARQGLLSGPPVASVPAGDETGSGSPTSHPPHNAR
ncbi:MAG: NAD(+)/NADH kinase [Acidimicrobiales bacterium]|nr:NAD(+)/NADH kinase [Acidimicrobiales bacterium]